MEKKNDKEYAVANLASIDDYNKLYGLPTLHPLVAVIDLKKATKFVNRIKMEFVIYALFLKNNSNCRVLYGREPYDYQEGTVTSFSPGQIIGVEMKNDELASDAIGLLFHPDILYGTPLGDKINQFRYFDYSQREALHLSDTERALFVECVEKINQELQHPVDHHSASVISANILVLLEYIDRFYDRQFITRHKVNSDIVANFERQLREYYNDPHCDVVPSVAYFAGKANLTPGYFGDLVKKETGITAQDTISRHIINVACQRLSATDNDISIIAYDLGFQYPQHFSRLFKRITGQSPTEYRKIRSN